MKWKIDAYLLRPFGKKLILQEYPHLQIQAVHDRYLYYSENYRNKLVLKSQKLNGLYYLHAYLTRCQFQK